MKDCAVCGVDAYGMYMVHDHVWAEVGFAKDAQAHIWCLEEKLGRPLTVGDLRDCSLNTSALYLVGRRVSAPPEIPTEEAAAYREYRFVRIDAES